MKKLFALILVWLVASCIIVTSCKAQETSGFIQMSINITEQSKQILDNNTVITINCISDKLSFNDTSTNFILVLHPNKEYKLTFKRNGCITKSIFISTIGISKYNNYRLNTTINLIKGEDSSNNEVYGELIYNNKSDTFDQLLTNKNNKNENNNWKKYK